MHPILALVGHVLYPAVGVLLGLLGFATLGDNLLGWLLFVAGVVFAAGAIIVTYVLRRNVWEPDALATGTNARASRQSLWLLATGLIAVSVLSPLEFWYRDTPDLPVALVEMKGVCLACVGGILFAWAWSRRRALYANLSSAREQPIKQSQPFRFTRHPDYFGCLLAALGLALGYASVWGWAALLFLLLPAIIWRVRVEDEVLAERFGRQFQEYAASTKRLIPGIW